MPLSPPLQEGSWMAESGIQTIVVCFGRALQEYLLVEDLVGLYALFLVN
jgi:hypothetical protein